MKTKLTVQRLKKSKMASDNKDAYNVNNVSIVK